MAGTAGYGMWGSSRFVRSTSRQKSKESKEESDSDDDELFDGEKLKTRLMSMWNNMRHGTYFIKSTSHVILLNNLNLLFYFVLTFFAVISLLQVNIMLSH